MPARLRSLVPSEAGIQRTIVEGLTALRYVVLVTTTRPKRCPQCQRWGREGSGMTPGVPDLLVWKKGWSGFLGLEVKSQTGRVRWEQAALVDVGAPVKIVRSWEEAMTAVREHR